MTETGVPWGEVVPLAGAAVAALILSALVLSNRLQRRLLGSVGRILHRWGPSRRQAPWSALAALGGPGGAASFFEEVPRIVSRVAAVSPVTLFLLDDSQRRYVAVHGAGLKVHPDPVGAEEPLATALERSGGPRLLGGRDDDLESAPIRAVNGRHIEACRASCAVPLRHQRALVGFLLCGGAHGGERLGLGSLAWLQGFGSWYATHGPDPAEIAGAWEELVGRSGQGLESARQDHLPAEGGFHVDPALDAMLAGFRWPPPAAKRGYRVAKRLLDIVIAATTLVLLMPVMLLIATAIALESPGGVLYSQERVGADRRRGRAGARPEHERRRLPRYGQSFLIHKFRSMVPDAESETGAVWATRQDPRVTRVGAFLRRTHLDELPQLLNVLLGRMTIVGPRPERPEIVERLDARIPGYSHRFDVVPGITGLAQVEHCYDRSLQTAARKLLFDLYYVRHRGLLLDLKIMAATTVVMWQAEDMAEDLEEPGSRDAAQAAGPAPLRTAALPSGADVTRRPRHPSKPQGHGLQVPGSRKRAGRPPEEASAATHPSDSEGAPPVARPPVEVSASSWKAPAASGERSSGSPPEASSP